MVLEETLTFVDWVLYLRTVFTEVTNRFFVAILTLIVGVLVGHLLGKLLQRILHEIEFDKTIKKTTKITFSLEKTLSNLLAYFIYFITIMLALKVLGWMVLVLKILSFLIILIIISALILIFKDILPNLAGGYLVHKRKMIAEGDEIEVGKIKGKVANTSLTTTEIRTKGGDLIYLPNSLLAKEKVTVRRKRKERD